jgi:hypothetical protein
MSDVVVVVPQSRWPAWVEEGDLPGEPWSYYQSHWMFGGPLPRIDVGERVYIVAFGQLRGYSPLVDTEWQCELDARRHCFVRAGGAFAVTIPEHIQSFRGWRYRWWDRSIEVPFPEWATVGVRPEPAQSALL